MDTKKEEVATTSHYKTSIGISTKPTTTQNEYIIIIANVVVDVVSWIFFIIIIIILITDITVLVLIMILKGNVSEAVNSDIIAYMNFHSTYTRLISLIIICTWVKQK